jgi:hypothetical protein
MKQRKMIVVLVVAFGVGSVTAHAQPSGAQAETLFRQGKELMAKGKIADACDAFDASQKLDPTIATLLNLASCREKNDQLATAWGLFLEAERRTRSPKDEATKQLHQVAVSHAGKLEPRLSTLAINVPVENRIGGLQVLRNTEPVEPGAWNQVLPVDGGTYKITARAPGNAEWTSTITVGNEHDVKALLIPKLTAASLEPRPAPGQLAPSNTEEAPDTRAPSGRGGSKLVPLAVGVGALVLAGVAVGIELSAASTYSQAKAEPDDARQESLWNSANSKRRIGVAVGAGSIACAGVAVWLYLRSGSDEAPASGRVARVQVAPVIGGDSAGFVVMGRY